MKELTLMKKRKPKDDEEEEEEEIEEEEEEEEIEEEEEEEEQPEKVKKSKNIKIEKVSKNNKGYEVVQVPTQYGLSIRTPDGKVMSIEGGAIEILAEILNQLSEMRKAVLG